MKSNSLIASVFLCVTLVTSTIATSAATIADCPVLSARSSPATDARNLRPDDIKVVAGIGDSIMAGFAAAGIQGSSILNLKSLYEIRGVSYAMGGNNDATTIPNFIERYSPKLSGASVGKHLVELCYDRPSLDKLNSAQTGAMAMDLEHELNYLLPALKNFPGIKYKTDWKMINIQIGSNDQCTSCIDKFVDVLTPEKYGEHLDKALARIQKNVPRVLVNLIGVFNVSGVYTVTSGQKYCEPFKFTDFMFNKVECACAIDKKYHATMDKVAAGYDQQVRNLYHKYKALSNENFAVMYTPAPINITSFPIDGFSNIDCFHPSTKGHEWIAKTIWNTLFVPQSNKPKIMNFNPSVEVYCPKDTDRFQSLRLTPSAHSPENVRSTFDTTHTELGGHDALRYGTRSIKTEVLPGHPLESRLEKWEESRWEMKLNMARQAYGMHAPIKLMMEHNLVSQRQRLPVLPSSNLHLDILMGKDETIDYEDFLNDQAAMDPTADATDASNNTIEDKSQTTVPKENTADEPLPPLIRTYNGYEYNVNDPKFKGLGTNAIKRLVKDEIWAAKRDERVKAQKEKNKRKRQELRQKISEGLVPRPPKRAKSKDMVLGNVKVILDCAFTSYMTKKELQSMQSQIVRCYSANRNAKEGMHFTVSSFDEEMKKVFDCKTSSWGNWVNVDFTEQPYEEKFDKKDLIYLSADSDNVAHELEEGKTYIIGGIVDKNRYKNLCQNKAVEQGIKTAQLPIGEYIQMASRKVLTVNQVFEIMLKWLEYRDWEKAFMDVIPQRKLKESKLINEKDTNKEEEDEGSDNANDDEEAEEHTGDGATE
ncbi:hypothetical protein EC973_003970 [Apophysomyces ossiformis]|uniref:tRNA (guanine(9)-N1)-methyltransferase n=1 Tax=Apophysomyces ossiformis TaxID=679940 RepID=A0A8H7BLS6_9FUNG|nr:hypothetical protein EC973_003970 [Apophysomyces ossiformis]